VDSRISPINSYRKREEEQSFSLIEDFNESMRNPDLIISPEIQSSRKRSQIEIEESDSPTSTIVMNTKRNLSSQDLSLIEALKERRRKERKEQNFAVDAHKQRILVNMSFEALNSSQTVG